ncbi:cytochrome c oxidase subunit II [Puniceicoccales bacterium CK1056]|uniref:Cytochrome c oxidase subunit 2 n=1 Tax=Oceanipulchritudo coccoides TaxID=2706888 RepID=A0A6B2M4Q3_9BACT|nr:cytochrome c oxidase subunit II [Oceanipulchritudo coccoides]NDV63336.1 cytochrome c oxidase subunit II [Oceanipulchritudo coccoides]
MKWLGYIWIGILLIVTAISIPQCLYTGEEGSFFNMTGQQSALDPMGPIAQNQANIFYITLWVTLFLFITVGGALAFAIWKFRVRKGDDPNYIPPQSHGHPLIEVGLVVASAALLVVIAIPTFGGIILKKKIPAEFEADAIDVTVTGYQWWWGFEYPEEGIHTANELVFPAGRAVRLSLRANDVIHSFWLPKLAGKTDLMPGQQNMMWIKADEPGYFWGQCAEYCGDSHAYMLFRARALSEEDWEAWLASQKRKTVVGGADYTPVAITESAEDLDTELIKHGTELFVENCVRCHSVDSMIQTSGPNLAHFGSRSSIAAGWLENNAENLAHWILNPDQVKPGNFMWAGFPDPNDPKAVQMEGLKDANLTKSDVDALVAYLYTLK